MEVVPEKETKFQVTDLEEAVSKDPVCLSSDYFSYGPSLCEKEPDASLRILSSNQVIEASEGGSGSEACRNCSESKAGLHFGVIKELHTRLQTLEEETEYVKKAFFGNVKERHELLNEVSQQLHTIHQQLRSRTTRQKSLEGYSLASSSIEDTSLGTGLSQVLHEDSNPSLVTRDLKSKNFHLAGSFWSHI